GNQGIELAETVGNLAAVEAGGEFAGVGIHIVDIADVAVIDLLVVVIFDLHHLVAWSERPAEAFDLALTGGIESCLQLDVERASADATAVHRAENLDVADRIEAKPLGDARLHQFDDPRNCGFGIVGLHEVEVAVALGLGEIWNGALVDTVGAGDDPALRRLSKYLGQAHDGNRARRDDVGQDLTGTD